MSFLKKNLVVSLFSLLVFTNIIVWIIFFGIQPNTFVKVSFLDIGQGDAILIQGRNGNQILIDGGPNRIVLNRLSKVMPFFDKSIDVVIETHPDRDHIGGLPEVLSRYRVENFIEPGVESDNSVDDELRRILNKKKINNIFARTGQTIGLGDGSYLEILFPDRDVSGLDTNDASIVARYIYGNSCFLLTGDSPQKIENYLVSRYGENMKCQVLKAGHHGSRTSTGDPLLSAVNPSIVIISAGKNNQYGHPHKDTLDRLAAYDSEVFSTIEFGTIDIFSDGQKIWRK